MEAYSDRSLARAQRVLLHYVPEDKDDTKQHLERFERSLGAVAGTPFVP